MTNSEYAPSQELLYLLHDLAAETLDERKVERLDEIIRSDDEARGYYILWAGLTSDLKLKALRDGFSDSMSDDLPELPKIRITAKSTDQKTDSSRRLSPAERNRVLRFTLSLVAATMALVAIALIPVFIDRFWFARPIPPQNEHLAPIASISRIENVSWVPNEKTMEVGTELKPGALVNIIDGLVEITFFNGATVVLDGRCHFKLISANYCHLQKGALAAHVPDGAAGFTVTAPGSRIVDLGTEFSVVVDENNNTIAQVLTGKVRASFRSGSGDGTLVTREMNAGDAIQYDIDISRIDRVEFSGAPFFKLPIERTRFAAYSTKAGTRGNQKDFRGRHGHDFVVLSPVMITRLGAFDSESDGLHRTLVVELWSRDENDSPDDFEDDLGIKKLVTIEFSPEEPGELVMSDRFKELADPIFLKPGAYSIVARGYGDREPSGNVTAYTDEFTFGIGRLTTDDGEGAIRFVGTGRFHGNETEENDFPRDIHDKQEFPWVNPFAAGTFEFVPVDVKE